MPIVVYWDWARLLLCLYVYIASDDQALSQFILDISICTSRILLNLKCQHSIDIDVLKVQSFELNVNEKFEIHRQILIYAGNIEKNKTNTEECQLEKFY